MMKRLDNKGFTLIELLAVIVILAVVMGIAATSVLGSMNKSRGESLANTASIIASNFDTTFLESSIGGSASNIYQGIVDGYDFTKGAKYYISSELADTFKIKTTVYALSDKVEITDDDINNGIDKSFVTFDLVNNRFVVCMFANESGNYYAANYVRENSVEIGSTGLKNKAGTMYACSDGASSWSA